MRDSSQKLLRGTGPQPPATVKTAGSVFHFPRPVRVQRALAEVFDLCSRGPFPAEAKPRFLVGKFQKSRSFWLTSTVIDVVELRPKHVNNHHCQSKMANS